MTLVELLVVMLLMGVIGSLVTAWQIGMQRTASALTAELSSQADVRTAMGFLTADLRMAIRPFEGQAAFISGSSGFEVTFFMASPEGPPSRVRYALEPTSGGVGRLVREKTLGRPVNGDAPWSWTSPARRTVLLDRVRLTAPLVTYYESQVSNLPPCDQTLQTPCATPLRDRPSQEELETIGSIDIRIATPGVSGVDSEMRSRVLLVNAGLTATGLNS